MELHPDRRAAGTVTSRPVKCTCYFLATPNGIAPVESVQVEEWQSGARRGATAARTGGPSGGRGCRSASVAATCGTPATASGATTSISAGNGDRDALLEPRLGHRKLAGVPKAEVAGLSNEKVTEILGTGLAQLRAI